MIRIAITPGRPRPDEALRITTILEHGWDYVHLRFHGVAAKDVLSVIENISPEYYHRLTIHNHFDAPWIRQLGGVHLNRMHPLPPRNWNGRVSKSCHSFDDLHRFEGDYATLSPVFESISKSGYGSDSKLIDKMREHRKEIIRYPVIALGGITCDNVDQVLDAGFAGFAVLGDLAKTETIESLGRKLEQYNKIIEYLNISTPCYNS